MVESVYNIRSSVVVVVVVVVVFNIFDTIIAINKIVSSGRKEMFYLTTHSHFTYGYMASNIW